MLSAILSLAAPAIFSSVPALAALGVPSFVASGIGSGLGALLEGRKGDEALQAAALGGLGGALAGGLSAPAGTTMDLAKTAAQETAVAQGLQTAGGQTLNPAMTSLGGTAQGTIGAVPNIAPTGLDLLTSTPALAAGAATGLGLPPITPEFKKKDDGPEPPDCLLYTSPSPRDS